MVHLSNKIKLTLALFALVECLGALPTSYQDVSKESRRNLVERDTLDQVHLFRRVISCSWQDPETKEWCARPSFPSNDAAAAHVQAHREGKLQRCRCAKWYDPSDKGALDTHYGLSAACRPVGWQSKRTRRKGLKESSGKLCENPNCPKKGELFISMGNHYQNTPECRPKGWKTLAEKKTKKKKETKCTVCDWTGKSLESHLSHPWKENCRKGYEMKRSGKLRSASPQPESSAASMRTRTPPGNQAGNQSPATPAEEPNRSSKHRSPNPGSSAASPRTRTSPGNQAGSNQSPTPPTWRAPPAWLGMITNPQK